MRDFEWGTPLWAVIKNDGNYAGCPCLSPDEAWELACQHEGAQIFSLLLSSCDSQVWPQKISQGG